MPMPILRWSALLGLAATVWLLAGCNASPPAAPLPTVPVLDLERYAGRWYEIAMLPNKFQAQCVADTQARYRALDGDVEVVNRCRQADGTLSEATGIAKRVANSGNAKLRVSFFRPFYGDYWVLALDPDYQWALVGDPSRQYGWVLSRNAQLSDITFAQILDRAAVLGYDKTLFERSLHLP